jgi:molybdopterin/thiamine biosynthesis adenylyltransferase
MSHVTIHQCRMDDVGKAKAEVAAKRVMERVAGCTVTPHVGRIEERPDDFYKQFPAIILGLDSLEARRYMNQVACSFLGALESRRPCAQWLTRATSRWIGC